MVVGIEGIVEHQPEEAYKMPSPVMDHQPLSDVPQDIRGIIEGQKRESTDGAQTSVAYIRQRMKESNMDLKQLTYIGKNPITQFFYKTCYKLHLKSHSKELEKVRNDVERRIADDQGDVDSITDLINNIDMQLEGTSETGELINKYADRRMMKNAEALVLEYEDDLNNEQRQRSEEEEKTKEIKDRFFQSESDTEKQNTAELYHAYEQNIQKRKTKEKSLKDKLATVSRRFNLYYDNVDRTEGFKAKLDSQREYVMQDKATLEGVSYDLRFFINMGKGIGALKIAEKILSNQSAVQRYGRLITGLEKVHSKQGEITRSLPDIIESGRRKTRKQKEEDIGKLKRNKENEIQLAKQRIKKSSGLQL